MGSEPSKIAIVGFGLMGAQIAQVFALSGFTVSCYDLDSEQVRRGLDLILNGRYGLKNSKERGKLEEEPSIVLSRITPKNSIEEACSGAFMVLEAAIEDLKVKSNIFQKASSVTNGILASNTSTLSISSIGNSLEPSLKSRVAGMHFFNPPQVMKLVEIVRTRETSESTLNQIVDIARRIGKTSVLVLDIPGFIANRIGLSVFAEASSLLEKQVASARDIDIAMRLGYGYPLGPFELGDLVGLDSRLRNMQALFDETRDEKFRPPEILKKLVGAGFIGDPKTRKGSKGGYYEYFGLARLDEAHTPKQS